MDESIKGIELKFDALTLTKYYIIEISTMNEL